MAKLFQKTCKMTNIDKQTEDNFQERIIDTAIPTKVRISAIVIISALYLISHHH